MNWIELKKIDGSDSSFFTIELIFWFFDHKKQAIRQKNWCNILQYYIIFKYILLFLLKKDLVDRSCRSFKKSDLEQIDRVDLWKRSTVSESILSFFKKDRPWANRSSWSFKKINRSDSIFFLIEWIFRSFIHKKRLIWLKNRWLNSQPWIFVMLQNVQSFSKL